MSVFSFTAEFGNEEECRLHFKRERDTQGVFLIEKWYNSIYSLTNNSIVNVLNERN